MTPSAAFLRSRALFFLNTSISCREPGGRHCLGLTTVLAALLLAIVLASSTCPPMAASWSTVLACKLCHFELRFWALTLGVFLLLISTAFVGGTYGRKGSGRPAGDYDRHVDLRDYDDQARCGGLVPAAWGEVASRPGDSKIVSKLRECGLYAIVYMSYYVRLKAQGGCEARCAHPERPRDASCLPPGCWEGRDAHPERPRGSSCLPQGCWGGGMNGPTGPGWALESVYASSELWQAWSGQACVQALHALVPRPRRPGERFAAVVFSKACDLAAS